MSFFEIIHSRLVMICLIKPHIDFFIHLHTIGSSKYIENYKTDRPAISGYKRMLVELPFFFDASWC